MDAEGKLRLFATQMHLEPAEDADARPISLNVQPIPLNIRQGRQLPFGQNQVMPCGQVADSQNIEAKRQSLGVTEAVMPGLRVVKKVYGLVQ